MSIAIFIFIGFILGSVYLALRYERTIIEGDKPNISDFVAKTKPAKIMNFKKQSDKKKFSKQKSDEEGVKTINKVSDIQLNAEKKEKIGIDRKKLIIYSEIITPKYKEF